MQELVEPCVVVVSRLPHLLVACGNCGIDCRSIHFGIRSSDRVTKDLLLSLEMQPQVCEEITLLVPTLGRDQLAKCLQSVARGTCWPARVIIIDQGKNHRVGEWIQELRNVGMVVDHIRSGQRGTAAATNRGIEQVKTRFLALTHDDCIVAYDWLQRMYYRLQQHPNAVHTGRVNPGGEGVVLSIKTSPDPKTYARPLLTEDILYPNNMGAAVQVFEQVGLFDERVSLIAAEDNDWAYRALRADIIIIYEPEVVVEHLDWRDRDERALTYQRYAQSQGGFYGKYLRRGDWFIALRVVLEVVKSVRRWLVGSVARDPERILSGRISLRYLFPGIIAGWKEENANK